jgi:hypothetical protein
MILAAGGAGAAGHSLSFASRSRNGLQCPNPRLWDFCSGFPLCATCHFLFHDVVPNATLPVALMEFRDFQSR